MQKRDDPIDCTEPAVPDAEPASAYGRWSRRKARARAAPVPAAPRAQAPASAAVPAAAADGAGRVLDTPDAPPERALTDADMPALEALGEDDDYSGFLSPGVSEPLRLKALRKLFTSAKFNVTDGLDDYAEDFTKFEPLGDIITSDMRHRIEMEAERARQAAEDEAREALARDATAQPEAALENAAHGGESGSPGAPDQTGAQVTASDDDDAAPPAAHEDAAAPPAARTADRSPAPLVPADAPGTGLAAALPRAQQQRDDG